MNFQDHSLGYYVDLIDAGKPYSFVRYGDGEYQRMIPGLRDKVRQQEPELSAALVNTVQSPHDGSYFIASQPKDTLYKLGCREPVVKWVDANVPGILWHNGDVFHRASGKGVLYPLVRALHEHKTVVVGPSWLTALPFYDAFIEIPHDTQRGHTFDSRSWSMIEQFQGQIQKHKDCIVSISCGAAAKVLIHRLHTEMHPHSWLIDFGSLWDVYCGHPSRRYHHSMSAETMARNLGMSA